MLQNKTRNAAPAEVLGRKESKLSHMRSAGAAHGIASTPKHPLVVGGRDQGDDIAEVDFGQLLDVGFGQLLLGGEEAPIDRLAVESLECLQNASAIGRRDGENFYLRAIVQSFVCVVVARINHWSIQSIM